MFKRIGHFLLVVALVATIGGHWAMLQTVAWTTMLTDNLKTDSFAEAVTKTFDGNHPCTMCKEISAGKQAEKKTGFSPSTKKLEFVAAQTSCVFRDSERFYLLPAFTDFARSLAHQPPVPPPRSFIA